MSRAPSYGVEHDQSVRQRMAQPKDLLQWYMAEFRAEMPESMHIGGVWRDRRRRGEPADYKPVGGSVLGAPRAAVPFEVFIDDSPFACEYAEYDGHEDKVPHYIHPIRAALSSLAGRGREDAPRPFMARTLYRVALMDGDWEEACRTMGIIQPVAWVYIQAALYDLWSRYSIEPPARTLRDTA